MYFILAAVGLIIGGVGTLIGAGGGFLLMPLLVLLYPKERPETLASISLAVVFFNATSGSVGYARQKNIDYKSGWLFVATGIPGAIGGALVTSQIPRSVFDLWLGSLLVLIAAFLIVSGTLRPNAGQSADPLARQKPSWRGAALSFGVGFMSSLLGIGGGIIHVPGMVYLLKFPVHLAAGTSHFVLSFTSAAGTAAHFASGEFHSGFRRTAALAVGVIIGAQIGARLSKKTPSAWILRVLAIAMGAVGVRVILQAIHHHT
jgi:uncharacterized membrane protein YfcA